MTNTETHTDQKRAWESGYREALLDVYLFLTGNDLAFEIELERFNAIAAMAEQITTSSMGRLKEAEPH